jgi:1,4-dihydroxy-2-naphthoate polyprenyltransferase
MSKAKAWILASRPKTLPAAIAPVAVGTALAFRMQGSVSWLLVWATLLSAIAIQIATNFFNDALDFQKGADTTKRLGPTRATSAGLVSAKAMFWAGGISLLLASLLALPLFQARGWPLLLIGLPSLYFSFGYTGGPVPLAYRGLGDFFVLLFFGFIAVAGTVWVLTGQWTMQSLVAGAQIGLLSTVLIAINNLRDVAEDRTTNKRTLAVRFGETFARVEIWLCCLVPHVLGVAYWKNTAPLWALPVGLLGILISLGITRHPPSARYNKFLALSGLQLVVYTGLFCWGLVRA